MTVRTAMDVIALESRHFEECNDCQGEDKVRSFNIHLTCPYYIEATRKCLNRDKRKIA